MRRRLLLEVRHSSASIMSCVYRGGSHSNSTHLDSLGLFWGGLSANVRVLCSKSQGVETQYSPVAPDTGTSTTGYITYATS